MARAQGQAVRMRSRREIERVYVGMHNADVKAALFWVLGGDAPESVRRAEAIPYRLVVDGEKAKR